MSKFKINDMVICTKECIDFSWYFTTPTRIINYPVDSVLVLEGFGGGGFGEDLFELAPTPKFEVGNYVTYKAVGYDKWKIKKIIKIKDEIAFFSESKWINIKYLTLVCNFTKGQEIEVGNDYGFSARPFIFIQYRPELASPFECVINGYEKEFKNDEPYSVTHWKCARPIQPKYKAYEKFNSDWIEKNIKGKLMNKDVVGLIMGKTLNNEVVIRIDETCINVDLDFFFKSCTWLNNTPCGENDEQI